MSLMDQDIAIGGGPIGHSTIPDDAGEMLQALHDLPEYGHAVIIEHDGKALGALIPMMDLELYERLFAKEEDRLDNEAADLAIAEGGDPIPWRQVKAELGL